jgi:hypothetical protein
MIKVEHFTRKQPDKSSDYTQAYNAVNTLDKGGSVLIDCDNIKVCRKYVYDLALKQDKEFATRKRGINSMNVTRLS